MFFNLQGNAQNGAQIVANDTLLRGEARIRHGIHSNHWLACFGHILHNGAADFKGSRVFYGFLIYTGNNFGC